MKLPHFHIRRRQGVALIITLILLSVITFMAIAFLVLSRTEKGSVTTATEQARASLGASAALERAQAEVIARILATTNEFNYEMLVSTNYINYGGFTPGNGFPTNVNYDTTINGVPLSQTEFLQNVANLEYDARPPVFVTTNLVTGALDFRYYLDLNRNGRFEPSGMVAVTNADGTPAIVIDPIAGSQIVSNFILGDPHWIGGLEFPSRPHAADNLFSYRYAYLVVPAGQTLDINYIHNQAARPTKTALDPTGADFMRNQGVGTYEINLAALLHDLNTNVWGGQFDYNPMLGIPTAGVAFQNAGAILANRYAGTPGSLGSVLNSMPFAAQNAFGADGLDGYAAGPPQGYSVALAADPDVAGGDRRPYPWSGSDNTNHFFSPQEFFNPARSSPDFVARLTAASSGLSTYDRYTFYRLLSQLGTDSAVEDDKIDLNYANVDSQGNVVPGMVTNFWAWQPEDFFTNAATRLLRNAGFNFDANNIQVYPTNYYTASVHRLLQLAANIYDSTTNRAFSNVGPGFPTVFRPVFLRTPTNFVIAGYEEVSDATTVLSSPMMDLKNTNALNSLPLNTPLRNNFYGIPLVIGARKGYPNFNEFSMEVAVTATRKLEFWRNTMSADIFPYQTNQMLIVGISNKFGAELWNSYAAAYPRRLAIHLRADISAYLTNQYGRVVGIGPAGGTYAYSTTNAWLNPWIIPVNTWTGYPADKDYAAGVEASFKMPLLTNWWHMTNSTFVRGASPLTEMFVSLTDVFEQNGFPVPQWWLNVRTRLNYALVDPDANRIVDYVNLDSTEVPVDITSKLSEGGSCGNVYVQNTSAASMWCTNTMPGSGPNAPTYGVMNQIYVSRGLGNSSWGQNKIHDYETDFFRTNFCTTDSAIKTKGKALYLTNHFFAPYTPSRTVYYAVSWQANDPLVHYTIGDLTAQINNRMRVTVDTAPTPDPTVNFRAVNQRYEPWDNNPESTKASPTRSDLRVKDSLVLRSDDWDFPTNKFANPGWLGRVHRGTPWQTVYLKSSPVDLARWQVWSGNGEQYLNAGRRSGPQNAVIADAGITSPTNDWALLDLFTTGFNENSVRGKLSVNQSGLAAWSAVLSGVVAVTNMWTQDDYISNPFLTNWFGPVVIPPAGVYDPTLPDAFPAVKKIVDAVNRTRSSLRPNTKTFTKLGDILAVPELTVASPLLNTTGDFVLLRGITDTAYERIPQQILGLLKCDSTPRFVVYSYGQALKPANKSIVTASGSFFGLCTNYQVTAESATRAVVRVEGAPNNPRAVIESYNILPPD